MIATDELSERTASPEPEALFKVDEHDHEE